MTAFTSELAAAVAEDTLARLERYARVDTQSAREQDGARPSTPGQFDLARLLVSELRELGLSDASVDEHCYVMATLPGDGPVVGLLAHLDVSPDAPGFGVEPVVHRAYDGGPITLPRGGTVVEPGAAYAGDTIMTSSGDTLLGADDKAGVAEIMAAVAWLVAHPELPRPALRIGFSPDEEIGEGALEFDIERFGAHCAYTIDGSDLGELQDETFTAAEVIVEVTGVDIHPGWAKDTMVNALRAAGRILAALPPELSPERTSGREGFVHPHELSGDAAHAKIRLIARDFEDDKLAAHVALVERVAGEQAGDAQVAVTSRPQYPNMREHLKPFPEVVAKAERAIRAEGLEVVRTPIRGGTDGSILSARGLPTPNLFTGGHEYHSVREWASLREMAAATATIVRLAGEWAA
ncbi:MAG TPA: peptidase T [Solirubrobacteraceae bacterium]